MQGFAMPACLIIYCIIVLKMHPMIVQAEAERRKRAQILESEGRRQSEINVAEVRPAKALCRGVWVV